METTDSVADNILSVVPVKAVAGVIRYDAVYCYYAA